MEELVIIFEPSNKGKWIETIAQYTAAMSETPLFSRVVLHFQGIEVEDVEPAHLVTLACFIEAWDRKGAMVRTQGEDKAIGDFLHKDLKMSSYWGGRQNYVPAADDLIFNLWRINPSEAEFHSIRVHNYFQQLFPDKDLSAVKNSLDEAYQNIFDHAQAQGNAFSIIKFDEQKQKLHVAVCDFGLGTAATVKAKEQSITSDENALYKAMENTFTAGSQKHNRGLGLGNIRDACRETDALHIVSNRGRLYAKSGYIESVPNNFHFPGTLIYYELSLAHFDELEIIDTFEL